MGVPAGHTIQLRGQVPADIIAQYRTALAAPGTVPFRAPQ
jgi:hypothetical protein